MKTYTESFLHQINKTLAVTVSVDVGVDYVEKDTEILSFDIHYGIDKKLNVTRLLKEIAPDFYEEIENEVERFVEKQQYIDHNFNYGERIKE